MGFYGGFSMVNPGSISSDYSNISPGYDTYRWEIIDERVFENNAIIIYVRFIDTETRMLLIYKNYDEFYTLRNIGKIDPDHELVVKKFTLNEMEKAIEFAETL